jgi:PAS domain S-box-containing protein
MTRVLIVDDDERNLLATSTVLEDIAEVVTARSGEEALRCLLKDEFAVILLDVYMPGLDGYETAQIIRQREQSKRIPIIFLSAVNKENEHLLRGYSMGAVDYVFKPVEPVFLRSKVAVFVDLFNMTKEVQRKARKEQQLLDANLRANAERLRAEQELRLAEQRQAAIIRSLPIVLYLEALDAQPRAPKFVSGNFAALTGFRFEDVQAQPGLWMERLHPEDRERVAAAVAARARGGAMGVEYRWMCADGRYRHFLDQAVMLSGDDGRPAEYAGTLLDISDRKELETQLTHARKLDAIGKLTGGIAHDFNNLLASVLGGISLIERRVPLNEEQAKIVGLTRRAAEHGSELIGRLLAFARRQHLTPAAIDPAALFASVSELLVHTLGGLVELRTDTSGTDARVFADESQLELALMNLVINARDAMPKGGVITLSASERTVAAGDEAGLAPGQYVVIAVADDGVGIPPGMLEQVMEPFFTTKEVGKGTGLGLSMVYGFARQSGGAMRIESTVDVGTRAEIWLPKARDGMAAGPGAVLERMLPEASRPLRLILVDDHEVVRRTTAAMLVDLGHTVTEAADAHEVLELLESDPARCDMLVSDYAMPVLSGAELIRRARQLRPQLPAVLITGYADTQTLTPRADDVLILPKPFTAEEISRALGAAMSSP